MDLGFEGRHVVVCGASSGMGLATARILAAEGASLCLVARRPETLEDAAASLPGQHWTHAADLSDAGAVTGLVETLAARWDRLDGLLLNTGGPPTGDLVGFDDATWRQAIETMLMSVVRLVRGLRPLLARSGSASVVAIESFALLEPPPLYGLSSSVRSAVIAYLKTAVAELSREGIRFNAVSPGSVMTHRSRNLIVTRSQRSGRSEAEELAAATADIPLGRFADPDEIGRVLAFLLSPASSYVTGINLAVDGGRVRGV